MLCFTFFSKQIDSVFSMLVVNVRPTRTSKNINVLTILLVHFISLISDVIIPLKEGDHNDRYHRLETHCSSHLELNATFI